MNLGGRIAQVLSERGLSQVWLSRVSGVDEGTISALIVRDSTRSTYVGQIAAALDVDALWLLMGESAETKKPPMDIANVKFRFADFREGGPNLSDRELLEKIFCELCVMNALLMAGSVKVMGTTPAEQAAA